MTIKLDVKSDKTESLMDEIRKFATQEANELVDDLYRTIKANTPVDSGAAKAAWETEQVNKLGDIGEIGNPKDYLKYVEDGTVHIAPRKFITRSIIKVLNTRK